MALIVQDLLELNTLKSFRLIAGATGLEKPVEGIGIVDWEFTEGVLGESAKFDANSFVISSLLFAKEDRNLIINAVEKLIFSGVSAMAYKDVIVKELPAEAIQLADERDFPIFVFDNTYFEDILMEINDAIQAAKLMSGRSEALELLLTDSLSSNDMQAVLKKITTKNCKNSFAAFLTSDKGFSDGEIIRLFENSKKFDTETLHITVGNYNKGAILIVSADHLNRKQYKSVIEDLLSRTIMQKSNHKVGYGNIHPWEELNNTIREAYEACIVANLENQESLDYQDIGVYQFLLPNRDRKTHVKYMKEFLGPILDLKNHQTRELLETAIAFVRGGGNFKSVSEDLHIHENTLRYRLSKLHKTLDPNNSEFEFYQNLSLAIKMYLIL